MPKAPVHEILPPHGKQAALGPTDAPCRTLPNRIRLRAPVKAFFQWDGFVIGKQHIKSRWITIENAHSFL